VFGIAYNLLCEYIRRRTIRGSAGDPDEVSAADLAPRPSSVLRMREDRRMLMGALRLLPIAAQTLIEMFYFEELTTGQIAELLGIPDNTVRGRLSRARARLRELVDAGTATAVLARDDDDELGALRTGYTRALTDDDDDGG
jgi:RNA polymerase sigma-70 factor (ECF subfamily)